MIGVGLNETNFNRHALKRDAVDGNGDGDSLAACENFRLDNFTAHEKIIVRFGHLPFGRENLTVGVDKRELLNVVNRAQLAQKIAQACDVRQVIRRQNFQRGVHVVDAVVDSGDDALFAAVGQFAQVNRAHRVHRVLGD